MTNPSSVVELSWLDRELWTISEAAMLLSGENPLTDSEFQVDKYLKRNSESLASQIYADLKDAIDLGKIQFIPSRTGWVGNRRVKPKDATRWAKERGYKIPLQLQKFLLPQQEDRLDHETPWLHVKLGDPDPLQPWYTPARYFARELIKTDKTLIGKKDVLAKKVAHELAEHKIYKRGGQLPLDPATVLKAFSNVNLIS